MHGKFISQRRFISRYRQFREHHKIGTGSRRLAGQPGMIPDVEFYISFYRPGLDNSDFHEASLYAKYCVGEASRFVGQQAIQLHGGMGLTKELDIGRLYKRLLAINSLHGDTDYIMELLVA